LIALIVTISTAFVPVAAGTMTLIPKLPPVVELVMVQEHITGPRNDTNKSDESINSKVAVEDNVVDSSASKKCA
jgi:hypothetical protein